MGFLRCSRIIRFEFGMFLMFFFVIVEVVFGLLFLMLGFEFRVRFWKFLMFVCLLWEVVFVCVVIMK